MNTNTRNSLHRALVVTGGTAMGVAMSTLAILPPAQLALAAGAPIQLADATHGPKGSHPDRLRPAYFEDLMRRLQQDNTRAGPLPQPRPRYLPMRPQKKAETFLDRLGAALAAVGNAIVPAAAAAVPVGSQVDLKVLVIATDGNENGTEPAYSAITANLDRLGVPYDTLKAAKNPNFRGFAASAACDLIALLYVGATAQGCTPTSHGAYYAIILASSNLPYCPPDGGSCYYSFEWAAWTALANYEKQFGVREASLFTVPGGWRPNCSGATDPATCPTVASPAVNDSLGLVPGFDASGNSSVDTTGTPISNAILTTTGITTGTGVFPYLNAATPLTIKYSYTYLGKPLDSNTSALLTIPDGSGGTNILAAAYSYPDGRQSLALTMANNANFLHSQLLAYGVLNWVTKGIYIGERRVSLAAQPDDLLIADDTYDPNCPSIQDLNSEGYLNPPITTAPMGYSLTRRGCTPSDLADALATSPVPSNYNPAITSAILAWYSAHSIDPSSKTYRITGTDLQNVVNWQTNLQELPNAASVMLEFAFNGIGATAFPNDTLMPVVLTQRNEFNWVSHTLDHMTLQPNAPYPNPISAGVLTPAISATTLRNQWAQNDTIATKTLKAANYYSDAVVMPSISGLDYYNAMSVLRPADLAIKYSVSDTSILAQQGPRANAGWYNHTYDKKNNHLVIPRFPVNLYYNVTTPEEWVAEYNYLYGPGGAFSNDFWKLGRDIRYEEMLDHESDTWLSYLVKGDRNPVMFHQTNLRAFTWSGGNFPLIGLSNGTDHTLLGDLINATLTKYNKVFKLAITSPALRNIGVQLGRLTDLYHNGAGLTATYTQSALGTQTIILSYVAPAATGSSTTKAISGCDPGYRPLPGPGADLNPMPCSNQTMTLNPTSKLMNPNPKPSLVVPVTGVTYGTNTQLYGGQRTSYVTVPSGVPVIMTPLTAW